MNLTRRNFLTTAAMSSVSIALQAKDNAQDIVAAQDHASHNHPKPERPSIPRLPALICKNAGTVGIDAAYNMLKNGQDTLDAALHLTKAQEDDPSDSSTGLGGLPNEEGKVQLDACCLHGPTRRGAAVGAVTGIRNASLLARTVMEQTGYSLMVGEDAQRFGAAQGLPKEDLITERTQKMWTVWKQIQSVPRPLGPGTYDPNWPQSAREARFLSSSQKELDSLIRKFEPLAVQAGLGAQWTWRAAYDALFPSAASLFVSTVNQKNEISCAATTSGLPWRMAGATGDIAVIGAGSYLDPEIGSAGATGNAEANITISGANLIVENMRRGMSPDEAGMNALRRIVHWYKSDMNALRFVEMVYYILRIDGAYSCVSLWHGDKTGHVQQFTIHDGVRRSEDCLFLLEGNPANGSGTPIPDQA